MAIFLHQLDGDGGADQAITRAGRALSKCGIAVDLVVGDIIRCRPERLAELAEGMRVVQLDAVRQRFRRIDRLAKLLTEYAVTNRPKSILSTKDTGNVIACLAKRKGLPDTRIVLRQAIHFSTALRSRGLVHSLVFWILARILYRYADEIILVADDLASDLSRITGLPRQRFTTIYNPTDLDGIRRKALDTAPVVEVPAETTLLVAAGRLRPQKDFAVLIRAMRKVCDVIDAHLVILGEGEERPRLEALITSLGLTGSVSLPGFWENPFPVMARADLFVLSSAFEGLPNVLIEALALGTNVVATRCRTGPREILADGLFGHLVPVGDADALGDAILRALREPLRQEVLLERAEEFSIARTITKYHAVLIGSAADPEALGAPRRK